MKKIYYLVLMAAALLVGTNAWAVDFSGTTRAELQAAIDAAATGTTITLQKDVTLDGSIWLGTETLEETAKSIILDLNGHHVSIFGTGGNYYPFVLTHGELLVRNSQPTTSNITLSGTSKDGTQIFSVYGSYRSSRWNVAGDALVADSINTRVNGYISHLEIGKRVKIICGANCLGAGIVVDCVAEGGSPAKSAATLNGKTLKYFTDLYSSNYGFAYGTKVDILGEIEMIGISSGKNKAYGIKVNGQVRSPREELAIRKTKMNGEDVDYLVNYVANRDNAGNGHCKDTIDVPYVFIDKDAKLVTNNGSTKSAAVYASGYAKWFIEGTLEGNIGIYTSSGLVTLHNADVTSTATNYTPPTGAGSVSGSGSGMVVNSRDGYAGDIAVVIAGDTEISADAGYGIEESVKTKDGETKVDAITVTGGTISGGDAGTVLVTETTAENEPTNITISGVTIEVDPEKPEESVLIGSQTLEEFLVTQSAQQGQETHVTYVDNENGGQTMVISEGAKPTVQETVIGATQNTSVNWQSEDPVESMTETLTEDMTFTELEINQSYPQTLIVTTGKSLSVGRAVLGKFAKIIVEPGATFIVTGTQGVVAPVADNILLQTSAENPARFLFNPAVESNTHPKATIEFITNSWWESMSSYQSERFGVPSFGALDAITCDKVNDEDVYVEIIVYKDYEWTSLGYIGGTYSVDNAQLNKPFATYSMLAYCAKDATRPTIRMKGSLVGNGNATLNADEKWAPFANSYTADMDVYSFLQSFKTEATRVEQIVYLAEPQGQGKYVWDPCDIVTAEDDEVKLKPMQAFILLNRSHVVDAKTVNYKNVVYDPAVSAGSGAPRRAAADDNTVKMRVIVTNEEGISDNVKLRENAIEPVAYEKYMNDDVNIYAMADEQCGILASENLDNTYLGFSTVNGGNFTISFAKVNGREFELIDLETGARVAVNEGVTYTFSADRNSMNDYRFKIAEIKKTPTAIEDIEVEKKANGIYTVMGQYVGEMNAWNSLPAGVYVVDGAKRVK